MRSAHNILVNLVRTLGLVAFLAVFPSVADGHEHTSLVKKVAKLCTDADFAWEDFRTCSRERGPQHKWCVSYRETAFKKDGKCQAARDELYALVLKNRKK